MMEEESIGKLEDNAKEDDLALDIDNENFQFEDDDIEKQLAELRQMEEQQKKSTKKEEPAAVSTPPQEEAIESHEENKEEISEIAPKINIEQSLREADNSEASKEVQKKKSELVGLIESRDKIIQEKDTKIMKLRQMNEKLVKELKILAVNFDKSVEKSRTKTKTNPYTDVNIKAREKELDAAQRQIKNYQRDIAALKAKLEAKTGYDKIIELENKLKEGDIKNQELLKEIKGLELIQKNQHKELEKLTGNSEANNKIKALTDQLKATKERNKELEKKILEESAQYQKQHTLLLDLQEKYQKLKTEKIIWKRALIEKKLPVTEEPQESDKKSEGTILKSSIASMQKRIEMERTTTKRTLDTIKTEISEYQRKIKEAEQENKLNTAKLSELKKQMRHNQLKPLNLESKVEESLPNPLPSIKNSHSSIPQEKQEEDQLEQFEGLADEL